MVTTRRGEYPNQLAVRARRAGYAVGTGAILRELCYNPQARQTARGLFQSATRYGYRAAQQAYNRASGRTAPRSTPSSRSYVSATPVSTPGGAGGYYVQPPFRTSCPTSLRARYGGKLRRKIRRKIRRRRARVMRSFMHHMTTPQCVKSTIALARQGTANQRQFCGVELCGKQYIKYLGDTFKPATFLYRKSTAATATTDTFNDNSYNNWHMHLDKHVWDMRIQNRSVASMELKVYECIVRHDVPSSSLDTTVSGWANIFQDDTNPNINAGYASGNSLLGSAQPLLNTGTGKGTSAGLNNIWQHPAFTPYNSTLFCETFKIVNTYTIKLGPNEITTKKFYTKPKQIKGRWIESGTNLSTEWMKGWSKYLLFSWVGMPVDDGTTGNQGKAGTDLFIQADITTRFQFTPGIAKQSNFLFSNSINGVGQNYWFNPSGFTPVMPVDQTVQYTASDSVPVTRP